MQLILKIIARVLAVLVGVIIILAVAVYALSESKINKTYSRPTLALAASTDPRAIARGQHLVTTVSVCVDCHGDNLGGTLFIDDPTLGRIIALNLTKGQNGLGHELSDADIARVLRYGLKPDGTSVKVMPAEDYQYLSDSDLVAIISYVRSLPPVDSNWPPTELKPLGRILLATGQLPILIAERIDPTVQHPAPEAAVSIEYGRYLANIAGCTGCHGPGLSGGPIPGAPPDFPPAANITVAGATQGWTEEQFLTTIRAGQDPADHKINPIMPWERYAGMTDDELKAIWAFIQATPPKDYGSR